jgi:hypothetical protein
VRPTEDEHHVAWDRIRIVLERDELGLPSFWQLQLPGWAVFYLVSVVTLLPYRKAEEFRN